MTPLEYTYIFWSCTRGLPLTSISFGSIVVTISWVFWVRLISEYLIVVVVVAMPLASWRSSMNILSRVLAPANVPSALDVTMTSCPALPWTVYEE